VNFSKVSHAKLDIEGTVTGRIRDGRALTSFS